MDLNRCSFSWYSWAKIYAGIDIKKSKIDISGIGYDIIDIHGPKISVPSLDIHGPKI